MKAGHRHPVDPEHIEAQQPASPTPHREEEPTTRVLAEALAEAADDLGKAANQFDSLAAAGKPPENNGAIFAEKEAKARAALARVTSPEGSSEAEARVLAEGEIADHADAGGRFLYDCPEHGLIEDKWVGGFYTEDEGDIDVCNLCPPSRQWAKDELKGPYAFPPSARASTTQAEGAEG